MSFKVSGKPPYRAMSEDWRRWSKTLASALLVGLPLGLSAQSPEPGEDLASRDVSEWKTERCSESLNWSTTLELKARATIKSLATNIAALPSLIAGESPASTHPLYAAQNCNKLDWSASWQQEAQFTGNHNAAFWVELDCTDVFENLGVQALAERNVTASASTSDETEASYSSDAVSYPASLQLGHDSEAPGQPIPRAQTYHTFGRVIDPSVYANHTLS